MQVEPRALVISSSLLIVDAVFVVVDDAGVVTVTYKLHTRYRLTR